MCRRCILYTSTWLRDGSSRAYREEGKGGERGRRPDHRPPRPHHPLERHPLARRRSIAQEDAGGDATLNLHVSQDQVGDDHLGLSSARRGIAYATPHHLQSDNGGRCTVVGAENKGREGNDP